MNKTSKVIFRMVAHNSEATIARAIDSVLSQTYSNLELHIGIRASADGTTDIANQYAARDSRIRVIINKQAFEYDEGNDIKDYYHEYDTDNDYLCFIDGDDEYKPDFLEKAITFAKENDLDIVAGGFEKVSTRTGALLEDNRSTEVMLIYGDLFETKFTNYYNFMRTRWGKLYRLFLTSKLDRNRIFWQFYSDDTVETLEYYRNAERIGIYPDSFYRWYFSDGSLSWKWDNRRIKSNINIFHIGNQFLIDKTGQVSDRNYLYLCGVYLGALRDSLEVLFECELPATEKLSDLHTIFTEECTIKTLTAFSSAVKSKKLKELIYYVAAWITENENKLMSDENIKMIADILSVMEIVGDLT